MVKRPIDAGRYGVVARVCGQNSRSGGPQNSRVAWGWTNSSHAGPATTAEPSARNYALFLTELCAVLGVPQPNTRVLGLIQERSMFLNRR